MNAYEEFLAGTVGPAVKLRDYIIGLKRMNIKQSEELERLRALCEDRPSRSDFVDDDYGNREYLTAEANWFARIDAERRG